MNVKKIERERGDKKMKRKNIVGLIAIVAIVIAAMLTGCVEEETPIPTPTPITTTVATPVPASTLIGEEIQELVIYSDVKDTEVYVNGGYIGVTSRQSKNYPDMFYCIMGNISAGSYKIELQKSGYLPATDEVQVPPFDKAHPGQLQRTSVLYDFAELNITEVVSQKTWYKVTSFSGGSDKTTQSFTIKGDEWRVKYEVKSSNPEYAAFGVFVYPRGETAIFIADWDCWQMPCSDIQYIYEGNGDYYFEIITANLDSWKLEVEDYY